MLKRCNNKQVPDFHIFPCGSRMEVEYQRCTLPLAGAVLIFSSLVFARLIFVEHHWNAAVQISGALINRERRAIISAGNFMLDQKVR